MLRLAGRGDLAVTVGGGTLTGLVGANLRSSLLSSVTSENFAQVSGDAQWTRPFREGQVRLGPRLSYRDAFALADDASERTFRSAAAELVLVLYGGASRVTITAGSRYFDFKPLEKSTWRGGGAAARGDFPLWRGGQEDEDSLDLTVVATVEQRAYRATAFTNQCAEGEPIELDCFMETKRRRGDRLHRASAMLSYAGDVAISLEGQLTVLDSNSFGRSSTSGRLRAAMTFEVGQSYVTTTGTLQLESYVDRLLVARDPDQALFELLEDDNRSSAELRIGRPLSPSTVLEVRLAGWLSISEELDYRRGLGSVGLLWSY